MERWLPDWDTTQRETTAAGEARPMAMESVIIRMSARLALEREASQSLGTWRA
jgi:hypothetical protein